jgi:hypothetical protein
MREKKNAKKREKEKREDLKPKFRALSRFFRAFSRSPPLP